MKPIAFVKRISVASLLSVLVCSCATSSGVVVNHASAPHVYQSAYVVVYGGNSSDMDALLQKELLRRGLDVTAGPDGAAPQSAQLIVKYADDWKWDITMYLHSLDVMAFDSKTHSLLATGSWKNSVMHGFYSEDKVVDKVVGDTLIAIGAQH
jgi:hypothetical protein